MSYDNPWKYNGEIFDSVDIKEYYGFVYHIRNTNNNRCYIGRKYFVSFTKDKGKTRRSKKESDWKKYYGSCPELKNDVKEFGKESFERTILSLHRKMGEVNYEETKQLFLNNVLMERLDDGTPAYYNSNILGRYMRKDYENFGRGSSPLT
jgi:hypothetical protein